MLLIIWAPLNVRGYCCVVYLLGPFAIQLACLGVYDPSPWLQQRPLSVTCCVGVCGLLFLWVVRVVDIVSVQLNLLALESTALPFWAVCVPHFFAHALPSYLLHRSVRMLNTPSCHLLTRHGSDSKL